MMKVSDSLKLVLAIQSAMLIAVVLDIPIVRQIVGFIYVSFIPGTLILKILRLNPKSRINRASFSVGLSIAFIMFVGLLINTLYPLVGVSEPLSILPLSVTTGTILLVMSFVCYRRDNLDWSFSLPNIRQVLGVLLLFSVPFLAIFGAMFANSLLLFLMIISVAALMVATFFSKKIIPPEYHAIVLLVIALSLLFQTPFISKHLVGYDIFGEFYVFKSTQASSLWNAALTVPGEELLDYNGMLSVTILPTVYSNLLNLDGELVFQIIYLLFYSLVPLTMYQMYKEPFGKSAAFLSAFYFVLFPRFYAEERRQIIGELFLVLLISLILSRSMNPRKRRILLVMFGAALVVSHYSISYIFLFSVASVWILMTIMKKLRFTKSFIRRERVINPSLLLLILILNISWYVFVTPSLGRTFFAFVDHIVTSFTTGFASVETRGEMVSDFVAPNLSDVTFVYKIDYIVNKIPYFLIIVGFIAIVKKFRNMPMEFEYLPIALANFSILLMTLAVPAFAPAFLAHRFYHVSLLFLAPVCVLGGMMSLKWIQKPFKSLKRIRSLHLRILCIFFIVIFLFKVGFVSEVTGDYPLNKSLSFTRMKTSNDPKILNSFYDSYVPDQDVYAAVWLSNVKGDSSKIYADEIARKHVLIPYGMVVTDWKYILRWNTTIDGDVFVYLRYFNLYGLIIQNETTGITVEAAPYAAELPPFLSLITENERPNGTQVFLQLILINKVYSNGGSEIYQNSTSNH